MCPYMLFILLMGYGFFVYALIGIFSGKIYPPKSFKPVYFDTNPITFSLTIATYSFIGLLCFDAVHNFGLISTFGAIFRFFNIA
ncbi:MAG: hypothetical protein A2287_03865 [Candidatus Melainabacteria bacterium RIFOXYA12_FULL_32_12]|nr:MAG: hypothetical protein A2255_11135 [Candidatus Melainabacteria bacterium RIFOXYA2_FULL_32_9]OGI29371.1 MAG: hypothetical protein A2287_03865 [Candidatus Melainabacteria bacterium RIFOXYA12_FULL_32_12]